MKVYPMEVEFGRLEPITDPAQKVFGSKYDIEIDDETVARWTQAIENYDRPQVEMEEAMNRAYMEEQS